MFVVIHLPTAERFYKRVDRSEVGSIWFCEHELNKTSYVGYSYSDDLNRIYPNWINNKEELFQEIKAEFYSFYDSTTDRVRTQELEIIEFPDV